jgi:hypothetical protein
MVGNELFARGVDRATNVHMRPCRGRRSMPQLLGAIRTTKTAADVVAVVAGTPVK